MNVYRKKSLYGILLLTLLFTLFLGCKKSERVYELLPPDPEPEVDITSLGTVSVNIENTGGAAAGEGSRKVVDNDLESKFLIFSYTPIFYIQLKFNKAQRVAAYTLTSANDESDRDPKNWTISGSDNGEQWVELDARNDQSFAERGQTTRYDFANTKEYLYYRINITSIGSGSLFQLAEWRLIRKPLETQ